MSGKAPKGKAAKGKATPPKRLRGEALASHAGVLLDRLLASYPSAHCALDFSNAFQLLCATILSAQCTDKRVNLVTPALFARYPDAAALAAADPEELEAIIRSTGFFRSKAKSLIGMAAGLVDRHGGKCRPTWTR
jgi:endonuclease III